jgi:hypothetical protein
VAIKEGIGKPVRAFLLAITSASYMLGGKQECRDLVAKIPFDSTIASLPGIAGRKRTEYIRRVVDNFFKSGLDRDRAVVRIGVQGNGTSPHYKIEYLDAAKIVFETKSGEFIETNLPKAVTYKIYHGTSHKEMTAFEIDQLRSEHWSVKTMNFAEVRGLLGLHRSLA